MKEDAYAGSFAGWSQEALREHDIIFYNRRFLDIDYESTDDESTDDTALNTGDIGVGGSMGLISGTDDTPPPTKACPPNCKLDRIWCGCWGA